MLSGKTVLVGITGGIAAYKICELIRMYKRANAEVLVVCTPNALNFVTKLTLENLSKNPVAVEEFEDKDFKPEQSFNLYRLCIHQTNNPSSGNELQYVGKSNYSSKFKQIKRRNPRTGKRISCLRL